MDVRPPEPRHAQTPDFQHFYREHYGFVSHLVRHFGVAPGERNDATQDTFVVAYRRLPGSAIGSPKSWLYGITRRVASNYRRGAQRAARKRAAVAQAGPTGVVPQTADALCTLDQFLAVLEPQDRELFVLTEVFGMSVPELAASWGKKPGALYARLRLMRARLGDATPDGLFTAVAAARASGSQAGRQAWAALLPCLGEASVAFSPVAGAGTAATASATTVGAAGVASFVGVGKLLAVAAPIAISLGAVAVIQQGPMQPALDSSAAAALAGPTTLVSAQAVSPPPVSTQAVSPQATKATDDLVTQVSDADAVGQTLPTAARFSRAPTPRAPESAGRSEAAIPPRSAAPPVSAPSSEATTPPELAQDNALIRNALTALAEGDHAETLAITEDHARRFPTSAQADVRWALRIEALCGLGKTAQARGEIHAFRRAHPHSPVVERVEKLCPSHER